MAEEFKKNSDIIFERFIAGLDDSISNGEKLKDADRDLQYYLQLQNERIKKYGLTAKFDYSVRGYQSGGHNLGNKWRDGHYINSIEIRSCGQKEEFFKNGKRIFKYKERSKIQQTMTSVTSPEDVADDDYMCPDCGATTKIKNLIDGCPSCGNRFKMSELYPKISDYHIEPDFGYTRTEMFGKTILPAMGITMGAFLLIGIIITVLIALLGALGLWGASVTGDSSAMYNAMELLGTAVGMLFMSVVMSIVSGAFFGWIIGTVIVLVRFSIISSKKMSAVPYLGTIKQFEEFMKKISPEYSYFFFAGKVMSMVKMMLLSDNPTDLPFYNGKGINPAYKNIIEVSSRGVVGLVDIKTEGDYVLCTSDVFLTNTYYMNDKITRNDEVVRVVMKKNVNKPINMRFQITGIHCPNCGGSFDATKNKTCPYCGGTYKMEDEDWSIEYLDRRP